MKTNLFNWQEIPFVRILVPFGTGIFMSEILKPNTALLGNALLLVALMGFIFLKFKKTEFRQRWLLGIPLSIALFLGGFQMGFYQNEMNDSHHFKNQIQWGKTENEHYIIGLITDQVDKEKNVRLTIAIQKIANARDSLIESSGNLLVYLKKDSTDSQNTPPFASTGIQAQYGDLILAKIKIRAIEPPLNPDAFDFQNYWHHQNLHFQSFINKDDLKILSSNQGNPIQAYALQAQARLLTILKIHLPTEREYAVGSALLLGYRDAVTQEVRAAYVETGSMHILAVSGMHIVLIFNGFEWLLSFYKSGNRRWRWLKMGIAVVLIWSFAVLTGFSASVVRAAMMSTILATGKALSQRVSIYNVLAASAFILLLINPFWLFDVGFQLSYLAVMGIVFLYPHIRRLLPIRDLVVSKKKKISYRKIWTMKALNLLPEALAVGLAAQLVVTPISLYYFHQFPTYFWLSSVFAVVVSTVVLYAGILLFFTSWIPVFAAFVGKLLFGALWLMNEIVFGLQKLPFSILDGFWLTAWAVVVIYLTYFLVAISITTRRLRLLLYPLSIAAVLSMIYAFSEIKRVGQKHIIVYHIYRNSLVDLVCGKKVVALTNDVSENISKNTALLFACKNHRSRLKVNDLETISFDTFNKKKFFILQNRVCQFGSFRLAILDRLPETTVDLHINVVLIQSNPRFSIGALQEKLKFDSLIFDGSNASWRVAKWKIECMTLGIKYHDTAEKGAWIRTISDEN